jgi:AcrR family transcriptional regulator
MPYRRTEKVARRLAARRAAILAAARALAAEGGMAAVQIAAVAERAGIAAGTVYRYFPSKSEMIAALIAAIAEHESAVLRRAAAAAPGPLSTLAAVIAALVTRAAKYRRLGWAVIAEPVEPEIDAVRVKFRHMLAAEIERCLAAAIAAGRLPEQDTALSARALVGAVLEAVLGPLAQASADLTEREVQAITLMALRAIGLPDARARGLALEALRLKRLA